ncbi:MAG: acetyl-CoA carboxylase biotin carboxyl carrier protein [Planctomycetota bacterium]
MTDLKTLRQLIKLMVDNELTELDLEEGGEKIRLKRRDGSPVITATPMAVAPPAGVAPAAPPAANDGAAPAATEADADEGLDPLKSPMVGTCYLAPSPEADKFVNVGDRVSADTVVCLIEAMKVFNEIKAEMSGTIEKVLVDNGQAVEFDQPIFLVRPD